ncbi:MAG: hypothetical protein JWM30_226 [Burkholderia sp.]|nr:hypothetical protein [Burkholderia sp.]
MLMAELPIAVLMQRQPAVSRWSEPRWMPMAVQVDRADRQRAPVLVQHADADACLVSGVSLQLYPDENDGYFENWVAPEPKVFLLWRVEQDWPVLVGASASYGEGTRMLDSGDQADGIAMPADVHAWLGVYLRRHYEPPARGRDRGR